MVLTKQMRIRIAHADVAMGGHAFSNVLWHTQFERGSSEYEECFGEDADDMFVERPGSLTSDLTLESGHSLIVAQNLESNIAVQDHSEVIVGGNVSSNSIVRISGIGKLFIAGDFAGTVVFQEFASGQIWVGGNFTGTIETGDPSTEVFIQGDYNGAIRPQSKAHLLTLQVEGFASKEAMDRICDYDYTQFLASISTSDVEPGVYPANGSLSRKSTGGRSLTRWTVQHDKP